jgi:hypothetical protein
LSPQDENGPDGCGGYGSDDELYAPQDIRLGDVAVSMYSKGRETSILLNSPPGQN